MLSGDKTASPSLTVEREGVLWMPGLYAWVIVTVVIALLAATLTQVEHSKSTTDPQIGRTEVAASEQ
jgi:hypothetical protein